MHLKIKMHLKDGNGNCQLKPGVHLINYFAPNANLLPDMFWQQCSKVSTSKIFKIVSKKSMYLCYCDLWLWSWKKDLIWWNGHQWASTASTVDQLEKGSLVDRWHLRKQKNAFLNSEESKKQLARERHAKLIEIHGKWYIYLN